MLVLALKGDSEKITVTFRLKVTVKERKRGQLSQ
jgi:hypothetical protein